MKKYRIRKGSIAWHISQNKDFFLLLLVVCIILGAFGVAEAIKPNFKEEKQETFYDVPLTKPIQRHIISEAEKNKVEPELIIAIIKYESNYNTKAKGDGGNSLGLMQIQPRWSQERMKRLDCEDLLNPLQNITVGIDLIAELIRKDKGLEHALMSYNGGEYYANKMHSQGKVSIYAKKIIKFKEKLKDESR